MQCQVGPYLLSNCFLMKAAISFSMLYFSSACAGRSDARPLSRVAMTERRRRRGGGATGRPETGQQLPPSKVLTAHGPTLSRRAAGCRGETPQRLPGEQATSRTRRTQPAGQLSPRPPLLPRSPPAQQHAHLGGAVNRLLLHLLAHWTGGGMGERPGASGARATGARRAGRPTRCMPGHALSAFLMTALRSLRGRTDARKQGLLGEAERASSSGAPHVELGRRCLARGVAIEQPFRRIIARYTARFVRFAAARRGGGRRARECCHLHQRSSIFRLSRLGGRSRRGGQPRALWRG